MRMMKALFVFAIFLLGIFITTKVVKNIPSSRHKTGKTAEMKKQDEHEKKEGLKEHEEEKFIKITEEQVSEHGIQTEPVNSGKLSVYLDVPGEVGINSDRLVHIVPRVPGVVKEVRKNIGDFVRRGEVMAILESRELADLKSAYLAAWERVKLAKVNFLREEDLWKKKISAEQEYLEAKTTLAEAKIELNSAEQKLHAIGFSEKEVENTPKQPEIRLTRYPLTAPFSGTVIEKHIALGEMLKDDTEAYVLADLSTVWVNLKVPQKDLSLIHKGQAVLISGGHSLPAITGKIAYVGSLIGEETRTAIARVAIKNTGGVWRPGVFVSARIVVGKENAFAVVSKTALQTIEEKTAVFVKTKDGFRPQTVVMGRSNENEVEITSGLKPGDVYVKEGAFTLKAELSKGAFGESHGH